ncbi:GAP family protein [Gordonia alkaliphila]|uniref:GAP family protein n=1 Tax=Gordonia alkaliphila TaxID=1053547 RepID=A0ABP8YZZ0_9ACTN|nr:GAP family protein [Gordonia alkaliphila]MCK0439153.1 GAP family protein [Gordonia alkaliphila]
MNPVIGEILPMAVGVAISPMPIIAVILMLLGGSARTKGLGFAVGWVGGLIGATAVFIALGDAVKQTDEPGAAVGWIKIVLGSGLLIAGINQFRAQSSGTPKWLTAIEGLTWAKATGLGFLLAAVNPKNLMLCAAAGVAIGSADLAMGPLIGSAAVFVVLASASVLLPVIAYLVAADALRGPLNAIKEWLDANNQAVMAVLFVVLGVVLVGKGLGGL